MALVKLFVLLTVLFIVDVTSKVTRKAPKFTYLGKFPTDYRENIHSSRGRRSIATTSIAQEQSFYFRSQNAAGWDSAAADCKAFLNPSATLLYIETEEELANITRLIQSSDDTGSLYWIGGRYDVDLDTFVWDNDVAIGSWVPWQEGHPNTYTPATRVAAFTVGTIQFQTQLYTKSNRFICEMKSDT